MLQVRVPATIANMGPGFDTFGMAASLYNRFTFEPAEHDALIFSPDSSVDVSALHTGSEQQAAADNIVFGAMNHLYAKLGQTRPALRVTVDADIPIARGLGSSSTAIVAGLVAANHMLGESLETQALLHMAIDIEGHPDNVAPALLGGVVCHDERPYALPWPVEWRVMTISPSYPLLTEEARRLLPKQVPMEDAIYNLRKASGLTYALLREDPDALRDSLHDRLHQPYRRQLIKEYDALERCVMDNGAFGMIISGSGSTMAVFYPTVLHARLLEEVSALVKSEGWDVLINDMTVDLEGARLLETVTQSI